ELGIARYMLREMPSTQALHPRRPCRRLEAPRNIGLVHPAIPQASDCRNRIAGVIDLMAAQKHRQRQVNKTVLVLVHQSSVLLVDLPILVGDEKGGARRLAGTLDFIAGLVGLSADNTGNAPFEDTRLFMRDRRQR